MSELFKDVPEFVETHIGESLTARTETLATFRELGPPDLCHVIKSSGSKTAQRDLGSYHYCSGVEASSSASLAAYLNSLQFSIDDTTAWFGGKASSWRVRSGTYCCFNAFSRLDMRVDVSIPGGVDAYIVDLRGDRHEPTPELWQETYLSAILRAICYADDASYRLAGYRKMDPITTPEAEQRFLKAAEELFFRGWQLGSEPEIQVATNVTNHLTAGIMKYFSECFRLDKAANLFEKMCAKDPEIATLLARSYIGMNEEIKAVKIMNAALEDNPQSYTVLHAQCDFLLSKGRPEWARHIAQQAVNSAPSEFVTWAKLTETYIELGQYDAALLSLNSCPMFTFNERDLHRMPAPARSHLPIKKFIADSKILDDDAQDNEADVALLRLPAPGLRGTFAKAYSILTLLVSKIGWDELLKTRSTVFVMEDEYRSQHKASKSVTLEGNDPSSSQDGRSPVHTPSDIPTIRISSESSRVGPNGHQLERPEVAQVEEDPSSPLEQNSAFSNKRLCERWLDNLFLVLYEDLRVYTIWRAEISHFKTQSLSYRKTGTEWEILGELALRLHHKEEAKDAFQRCLDSKFDAKALINLLGMYADEGDVNRTLNAAVRLTTYHHRWYMETAYPSVVAHQIFKIARVQGLSKLNYTLLSMNLPAGIFEICQGMVEWAVRFGIEGSEF